MKKILYILVFIAIIFIVATTLDSKPKINVENEVRSNLFSNETEVTILGYSDHAMEPFISKDGNFLFWNSLNDGKNTSLFYAKRVSDFQFEYMGEVKGANGTGIHLDGVASLDDFGNFYWVTSREYPEELENFMTGKFANGGVTNIKRVTGNFYVRQPGWIIMDAETISDGNSILIANARFDGGPIPVESDIQIINKNSDSFLLDSRSVEIFSNINTKEYLEYAPSISIDGKELFFTRSDGKETYVYLSTRSSTEDIFGQPQLLNIEGNLPEGPTLSADGSMLYYHKKVGALFKIYGMQRK